LILEERLTASRNGQFEETTSTNENAFIQNGMLFLKPTLQDQSLIIANGSIINLLNLSSTTCASTQWSDCVSITNLSNGTIVPPVKSARVSTRLSTKIKYGRVEVTAKMPRGDWLWPGIWMLPVNQTYGVWPRSGEIDIAESRGNGYTYPLGGNNIVSSTLHWGPNAQNDAWWRNNQVRNALHSSYADKFHTFGVEWSENYLFTYVDTRLIQVLYVDFSIPFWQKGQFPLADSNGTKLDNPWANTGRASSPFDEDFYLILSLGVGGTNGWFLDGKAGKPWVDTSSQARLDFWNGKSQWWPTWQEESEMVVKQVRVGEHCLIVR
jgi:Glycosyl hydrolases family 16